MMEPAEAFLEGLPETWQPNESYQLTLRVEGGPPALQGVPQGGFELEVAAGRLSSPEGYEALLRHPVPTIATYEPEGTFMRDWQVTWTAPGMDSPPVPIDVWMAVVSANGNHVVALNVSDQGEQGDATAALHRIVEPDPELYGVWQAMPLLAPSLEGPTQLVAKPGTALQLEGRHTDRNATAIAISVDGSEWDVRPTDKAWRVALVFQPGSHELAIRSEGADRTSPPILLTLDGRNDATGTPTEINRSTPMPLGIVMTALWLVARR